MSNPPSSVIESTPSSGNESKQVRECREIPGSTDVEQFKKEITSSDCLLIVMGTLAAGKTTFIYELMDTDMPEVIRSPDLEKEPDTREIDYRCIGPTAFTNGHRVFVIDTPPVIGSRTWDSEILVSLRDQWIAAAVKKKVSFVGIVFIQDLESLFVEFRFQDLSSCLAACVQKKIPHQMVFAATQWSNYKEKYLKDLPEFAWSSISSAEPMNQSQKKAEAEAKAETVYATLENDVWGKLVNVEGKKMVKLTEIGTWEKQLVMDMMPEAKPNLKTGWLSKVKGLPSRLSVSK